MPTFQGECEGVGHPGGAGWRGGPPRVGWHSCGVWLLPPHIASRGWGTSQDLRGWGSWLQTSPRQAGAAKRLTVLSCPSSLSPICSRL